MSYCIIVDSGSLIKNGDIPDVFVVPMTLTRTEKDKTRTLRDGIDINTKEMVIEMEKGIEYKTASPVMGECADLLDKVSKGYDQVYVLSLSSYLSGEYNQWILLADDYSNVHVYNTNGVCDMLLWIVNEIKALDNVTPELVTKIVKEHIDKSNITIIATEFNYLIKGGRINPIKLLIAKYLRYKLVLDLDKNKGVNLVGKTLRINMIPKIVNEHYKTTIGYNGNNIDKLVIFTSGLENEKSNVKPIVELLKANFKNVDIKYSSLPSVFTAHLGTNYVAIAIKCK